MEVNLPFLAHHRPLSQLQDPTGQEVPAVGFFSFNCIIQVKFCCEGGGLLPTSSAAGFLLLLSLASNSSRLTVKCCKCGSRISTCANTAQGRDLCSCSARKWINVDIVGQLR